MARRRAAPTRLSRPQLRLLAERTLRAMADDDVVGLAAAVAFKIFLSLFPVVLATAAIYALTRVPADVGEQLQVLARFLPVEAQTLVAEGLVSLTQTEQRSAFTLVVVGLVGGVVSASGAAATLIRALNRAYGIADERTFLARRLVGLAITNALFLALLCLLGTVVLGPQVRDLLAGEAADVFVVRVAFNVVSLAVAMVVLMILADFVYWIGPNRPRPTWTWLSPGAILGVLGGFAASTGFRLYLQIAADIRATYGYVAGVIVLLLWFQLSMLAILAGAELNAELERLRGPGRVRSKVATGGH